jgi:16S rRNA (guanine527-N7)-methyltransferase
MVNPSELLWQYFPEITSEAGEKLLRLPALYAEWNARINVVSRKDMDDLFEHHVLHSLALSYFVKPQAGWRILDVGTGGGFPGIPLAIARPDWSVTLLDSNHKKGVFLQQAVSELRLSNVKVVVDRVEAFRPEQGFDCVVSRAFSDLPEFAELSRHLRGEGGALLAMKGVYPYEEVLQLSPDIGTVEVIRLQVPGVDAERHLVSIGAA